MGDVSVKRVPFTSRSKIQNEVTVVFSFAEVRDIARGVAKELGGSPRRD